MSTNKEEGNSGQKKAFQVIGLSILGIFLFCCCGLVLFAYMNAESINGILDIFGEVLGGIADLWRVG